ncbi:MAG: sugar transferase [Wenzhouxiangellaceae bacterium]|nr:sugar transferase [Wenzhouxiangellaceae bacterium]
MRRGRDILLALGAIVLLWPFLLALAAAVRFDSRGPVFYSEERLGRAGKPFRIYKFRTLHPQPEDKRPVAPSDDPRVTRLGARLRPVHLDELPQLFNIARGEMRFVGPRPTREDLWRGVDEALRRRALAFTPGLTSPASLRFDCEDDVLAETENPEQIYRDVIFPAKVAMDVRHFEHPRRLSDTKLILATVATVIGTRGDGNCRRRLERLLSRAGC